MNTWDHLAEQAHHLLTRPRRADLTPAVTLIRSLHKQAPESPASICAHLETATSVLPQLARYAHSGDRHALLMAAVLMRHPLRRIAEMADPDGYRSSDRDARDNDTLRIFFEIISTAGEPQILTSRYLYGQTLKRVLKARPAAESPAVAIRVDPHSAVLDRTDLGTDYDHTAALLQAARDQRIITALEHDTLRALYLNSDVFSPSTAARTLNANVSAVERRAQRAIRKLCHHYEAAVARMITGRLSLRLATLAACLSVGAAELLSAAPSAVAAAGCPAIEAIAVPGTTQTNPQADPGKPVGVLGTILEPLRKNAPVKLVTYYTPYPATIIGGTDGGGYRASKNAGIDATNARLKAVADRCPRTVFILTGYSQGADVAGDIAAAIGHNRGVIPANRLLGVALVADPSQAPVGQPTIGLTQPGMGFAGVRSGGFGSLTQRNGLLSLCSPRDYYCNLPQGDLVMRFIGHLGSHLDASDPAGSAQKLATIFMAGLIAPATAAINQILTLVNDPNLIPNLIQRGVAFAKALTQQLFWLAGPQVAMVATELVNAVTYVINLVTSRSWAAIPAAIATIATRATAVGTALSQMKDKTATINVSGFGPVGAGLNQPGLNPGDLATAVINAISVATGGVGTTSTGLFGPTFSQFSLASVATSIKHYAEFIKGGFHENYDTTRLDSAGHTGTQIAQRYLVNQINKLV